MPGDGPGDRAAQGDEASDHANPIAKGWAVRYHLRYREGPECAGKPPAISGCSGFWGGFAVNQRLARLNHFLKSGLCLISLVNLHVCIGGCGGLGFGGFGGWQRIELSSDQPLKAALKSGAFAGITALDVNPATGEFRFVLPNNGRSASGTFAMVGGSPEVSQVTFSYQGLSATLHFDAQKRITMIENSLGQTWTPSAPDQSVPFGVQVRGVDAYVAANPELVRMIRPVTNDGSPGSGSPGTGGSGGGGGLPGPVAGAKAIQSAQSQGGDVSSMLGSLALILGLQGAAGAWPVFYFVLQVVVAVNLTMALFGGGMTSGGTQSGGPIGGAATLRVINQLPGSVPIWFVVLEQDFETGAAGGNLLGEEAIPSGSTREFAVPTGRRNFNIIAPNGSECFTIFRHDDVSLQAGIVVEIQVSDPVAGELYPADCTGI